MTDAVPNRTNAPRWRRVVGALLGVKLAYGLVVGGIVWWGEGFDAERAERIRRGWFPADAPPPVHGRWARHFATWDAEHYLYLSTHGYGPGVRSIAFYPLWPLVVRAAARLTGGNPILAGLVLANLFSLAGWVVFHRVAARRCGEAAADWALALLVAFPGALFFQFLYSEALFFLLLMGLWWGLERGRWGVAGVAAGLLPLTRAVGVFAVLPIAGVLAREHGIGVRVREALCRHRGAAEGSAKRDGCPSGQGAQPVGAATAARGVWGGGGRADRAPWGLLAAPVLGWGLYLGLMGLWTGNPWAGFEAQKYWGVHALSNLGDVPKFVKGFFEVTAWHEFTGSLLDRLGFLLVLYALPLLWPWGRDLLSWVLMLAVIPAMSGTFTSYIRFEACAFPVFLAWGAGLSAGQPAEPGASMPPWGRALRGGLRWGMLAVFAGVHLHLLWRFLNYHWAG